MHLSLLTVMSVASLESYSHPMVKDNPLFSPEININIYIYGRKSSFNMEKIEIMHVFIYPVLILQKIF